MEEAGWEFCALKFVKGSRGGLFLTYFLPFDSPLRLALSLTNNHKESTGLEMALAQLGRNGWGLVSKASHDSYFLKRMILSERPIDRPLLVGFDSRGVTEAMIAASPESEADDDSDLRLAAARMGVAIV